ncbi:glycosyltransferase family 4 protein [bacterium]|nr:glycosyltransferase family 4 protein [bacterium]
MKQSNKDVPKIVLGHSYWGRGGAEIATMWLIQALCPHYEIDIVTRGGWDLAALNRCAGTTVQPHDLGRLIRPHFVPANITLGGAIWHSAFLRFCSRIGSDYDIRISASRVIDWGAPAVHFLTDVVWNEELATRFGEPEQEGPRIWPREILNSIAKRLRPPTQHYARQGDVFVANSNWTASISSKYCARYPEVIYPPVFDLSPSTAWSDRLASVVCLGRLSPEKRIEEVIEIIAQIRARGHNVHLHLVGESDRPDYEEAIRALASKYAQWITLHGALYGEDKAKLLSKCRFGISACTRESFGMATAEMVKSGMIVFVPSSGGQREIVRDPSLMFQSNTDAVRKIGRVLSSESLQHRLSDSLLEQGKRFGVQPFSTSILNLMNRIRDDARGTKTV